MTKRTGSEVVWEGRFLRAVDRGGWESVHRTRGSGVVGVIAVTDDRKLVLVEQSRPAVKKMVIGLPAGLAGDVAGAEDEALVTAARRELLEETGYQAADWRFAFTGPTSSGLTSETLTVFVATDLRRVHAGGGDSDENITVTEAPLDGLDAWLAEQRAAGKAVDIPVYAALHYVKIK